MTKEETRKRLIERAKLLTDEAIAALLVSMGESEEDAKLAASGRISSISTEISNESFEKLKTHKKSGNLSPKARKYLDAAMRIADKVKSNA